MNESPKIPIIIERESCRKHHALLGAPCFSVRTVSGDLKPAICNNRARKAGFIGEVSRLSLSKSKAATNA